MVDRGPAARSKKLPGHGRVSREMAADKNRREMALPTRNCRSRGAPPSAAAMAGYGCPWVFEFARAARIPIYYLFFILYYLKKPFPSVTHHASLEVLL